MTEKKLFEYFSSTTEDTEGIGKLTAELYTSDISTPCFIALFGDLGAGKTAFVRGFCSVMCPNASVKSPSYSLVNEYRGSVSVFHFDVWRIKDDDDLYSMGFYDYLEKDGIILCEWASNIPYALPEKYIKIEIFGSGDQPRCISATLITENIQ